MITVPRNFRSFSASFDFRFTIDEAFPADQGFVDLFVDGAVALFDVVGTFPIDLVPR